MIPHPKIWFADITERPTMPTYPVTSAIVVAEASSAPDVFAWSVTAKLASIDSGDSIVFPHSKAGLWPWEYPPLFDTQAAVEGNLWAVCRIGSVWVAGTIEWLRPGQVAKTKPAREYGEAFGGNYGAYAGPQTGEVVGYFVSTMARGGHRSRVNERSNIIWVTFGTSEVVGLEGAAPVLPTPSSPVPEVPDTEPPPIPPMTEERLTMWKKFLLWLLKYVPGIAETIIEAKVKADAAKAGAPKPPSA